MLGVINATESLVEEIIETLMDVICLAHHNCVAFDCRVTNGCNCVDLRNEMKLCKQTTCVYPNMYTYMYKNMHGHVSKTEMNMSVDIPT